MRRRPKIAIIGGGIAGLAAALALFRRGIEGEVYEQAGELSEIGAGVQMTPNAMKALFALGLEQAAMRVAFEPEGQVLRSWKSGRQIYRAPIRGVFREKFGAPLCSFHRADLLSVLAAPLPPGIVHLGARCVAVDIGDRSAAARLPTAARSRPISLSAPTASTRPCAGNCSAPTSRVSPAVSAGAVWCRPSVCRRVW